MKIVTICYTDIRLDYPEDSLKQYDFILEDNIELYRRDLITSKDYTTKMQVVDVIPLDVKNDSADKVIYERYGQKLKTLHIDKIDRFKKKERIK